MKNKNQSKSNKAILGNNTSCNNVTLSSQQQFTQFRTSDSETGSSLSQTSFILSLHICSCL